MMLKFTATSLRSTHTSGKTERGPDMMSLACPRCILLGLAAAGSLIIVGCGSTSPTAGSGAPGGGTAIPSAAATAAPGAPATCPSASLVSTAAANTLTGPQVTEPDPSQDTPDLVCEYSTGGATELQVALAPSGTTLRTLTANVSNPTTPVSGLGDSAVSTTSPVAVYIYRSSAPGITVIDQGSLLTVSQVEAIAKAVIAG